jgi:hypothetical protein
LKQLRLQKKHLKNKHLKQTKLLKKLHLQNN